MKFKTPPFSSVQECAARKTKKRMTWTVQELKKELRHLGLPVSGTKIELCRRYINAMKHGLTKKSHTFTGKQKTSTIDVEDPIGQRPLSVLSSPPKKVRQSSTKTSQTPSKPSMELYPKTTLIHWANQLGLSTKGTRVDIEQRIHDFLMENTDYIYFKPSSVQSMEDQQKKYCRCLLHVASKEPLSCLRARKWGIGKDCVNPYAICTKSVGRKKLSCTPDFNLDLLSLYRPREGKALLALTQKSSIENLKKETRREKKALNL
mgnify:FL=1